MLTLHISGFEISHSGNNDLLLLQFGGTNSKNRLKHFRDSEK